MWFPAKGLAFRLALLLSGASVVLFAIFGIWTIRDSRSNLEEIVLDSGRRCVDVIRRSTRFSMLRNERDAITEIIKAVGDHPGLDQIRIYDAQGKIHYSTSLDDLYLQVDETAEACVACHKGIGQPPETFPTKDHRIFERPDGHRTMGLIAPIRNEPTCSEAECHAHDADQEVLGVLDVQMSLAAVDQIVSRHTTHTAVLSILVLIGLAAFMTMVLLRVLHRPIMKLIDGTQRVAAGDLNHRIDVRASGELWDLGRSFDAMTVELAAAREQSEAWAQTLESRVAEKSSALQRIQEEAIQMEKMASMGKLAAIVAHEINNPLAGIRTYARLLLKRSKRSSGSESAEDRTDRTEQEEILDQIEAEATRCGEIVKHLLQFSRPSRPQAEPCNINELLRSSMRLVRHQIDLKGLTSNSDLAEGLPQIVCDPQQIRQAFVAVLINACDAMTGEGSVTAVTRAEPNGAVSVAIRDTGLGIDEETLKHIFEPFYTTKEGGAGLGLAVVYGIIQSHGGRIDVDTRPGGGTTIRIHLPSRPPEREPDAEVVV